MNNILQVNDKKTLFSYNTTFNIDDFYMSPLVCRHPLLKNEPAFLCVYLFYEMKTATTHVELFDYIKLVT